jgi:hypothetical protein
MSHLKLLNSKETTTYANGNPWLGTGTKMWHCYLVTEIPGLGQVQKCGTVILVTEILASLKNISFFIKCVVSAIKDVLHIY